MNLYNIKELKELSTVSEANKFLEEGWKLVFCADGKFIVGRLEFKSHV